MRKLVYRDAAGAVINIGEWDFCPRIEIRSDEGGEHEVEVDTNPLPEGATWSEEDVVERSDGGLAAATDHASRRRSEYPPIAEQLDALWKGGADLEAMRARILDIKARHPKA